MTDDAEPLVIRSGRARALRPRAGGLGALLREWQADLRRFRNVTLHEVIPARPARHADLPPDLPAGLCAALADRGLSRLYSHQREAYDLATSGKDLVVATPTASGKSLCYHLPVLRALADRAGGSALYLFPTKALARDQEVALRALMADAGLAQGAITYDGDTPGDARRAARERAGIVLTNPDMLHTGILPHHARWSRLLSSLRYVVVDELHVYRGVFGSHLANVFRRLQRVAAFHGSHPVFLLASATIGNPVEHATRMIGRPVSLVGDSGAPAGPRRVLVYNPPVVNLELGLRQSYIKAAVNLAADLVRAGVPTLVFGQSRNNVEVMLKYLRDRLGRDHVSETALVAYRGGYLPAERRRIEQALREGVIRCVVATNALELGIDIGSLQAVVCAGYPGTLAGLAQRFGRGGRRGDESLSVLVTSSAPLDQYVARQASALLHAPVETARVDPDNVEILLQHLKCAAFELPFDLGDAFMDVPADVVEDALSFLSDNHLVHPVQQRDGATRYHWASDAYPAHHVSLRSVGWDNVVIIDTRTSRAIAEMDFRATHTMLHAQAIYQHAGEPYQVERLDFENHKAFVRKVEADYFTEAMTHVNVTILDEEAAADLSTDRSVRFGFGDVSVVEKVVGYKKIKYHTHENLGYGEVQLPEMQMHTTGFWLIISEALVAAMPVVRPAVLDALRGLAYAMHTVAVVALMIDPRDLGSALGDRRDGEGLPDKGRPGPPGLDPTIFLYDRIPGGIGLSPRVFEEREPILRQTRALIDSCPCDEGCPSCVGAVVGSNVPVPERLPSRRHVAQLLLSELGIVIN